MNTYVEKAKKNESRSMADSAFSKQGGREAAPQFEDGRPATVAQRKLQSVADNSPRAMQLRFFQDMAGNFTIKQRRPIQKKENNGAGIIQRRVALAKKAMTQNFVELTSIDYGLNMAGGPVELLNNSNFSGMTEGQSLAIVAHGSEGSSGDYSADEIAAFLTDDEKGLKKDIEIIRFTSCYAGKGMQQDNSDSVISVLKKELAAKGLKNIPITGTMGPCIKSFGLGTTEYTVSDKNKTTQIESQGDQKSGSLPANRVLQSVLMDLLDPQGKADEAMKEIEGSGDEQQDIKNKTETVRHATAEFYRLLVDAIKDTRNSWLIQGVCSGGIAIDDPMAGRIGAKWKIPKLTGKELKNAILGAAAHENLLLEGDPVRFV